jgi:hypothetical protein
MLSKFIGLKIFNRHPFATLIRMVESAKTVEEPKIKYTLEPMVVPQMPLPKTR